MTLPYKSLENHSFAEALRQSDCEVSVRPELLTKQLSRRRSAQRTNRVVLATAVPLGVIAICAVGWWVTTGPRRSLPSELVVQSGQVEFDDVEPFDLDRLGLSLTPVSLTPVSLTPENLLAAQQTRLNEARREFELLRIAKLKQDRSISREIASRTEISQIISAYEF